MKTKTLLSQFMLLLLFSFSYTISSAQALPVKQWDKTFGGSDGDDIFSIQQTSDGGYILGGSSSSNISGDKTDDNKGKTDFWVVKVDADGNKQWDKTFGGSDWDDIFSIQQTSDGGYILGGPSYSGISGNKTTGNKGNSDFWIIKIDANGNKQWEKTFGGSGYDELHSLQQTLDGGYILGGWSDSGISGDKTEENKGHSDYWIVKTDANGNKQWDKTYGGSDYDVIWSLKQTSDGGYILGGDSGSGISGDKSEDSRGNADFWIVKVDANGNKQWDKTYGGDEDDLPNSVQQTSDGGYILGGYSYSGIYGDKTATNWGNADFWVVKIDSSGIKQWDKAYGGSDFDGLVELQQTSDGGYILGGQSGSGISGNKTDSSRGSDDFWVVKINSSGVKQWDKAYGGSGPDDLHALQNTSDGGYILGGSSASDISGDKTENSRGNGDYWIVKLSPPISENYPKLSINDVSTYEGNSGYRKLKFRVHLSKASSNTVTVDYTTVDNTAKAPGDYTATCGTLTFTPGTQKQFITVKVKGDRRHEPDQTFKVKLSHPVNATFKDSIGVGTILNDDQLFPWITANASASDEQLAAKARHVIVVTPNPASSIVNIRLDGFSGNAAIQLISLQGKLLKILKVQGTVSKQLNVSDIASGTYLLAVIDEQGNRQTLKLVVVH